MTFHRALLSPVLALSIAPLATAQDGVAISAEAAKPLKATSKVPNPNLTGLDGKMASLKSILGGKPSVLVFYRGGWCPYCNTQLADLMKVKGELEGLGYQLIAISPDTSAELAKSVDKAKLSYRLYSDSSAEAMKAFGIAFRVEHETVKMYKDRFKIDLEAASGKTHHILPVPSVFLVDKSGKISYAYSNPDYRVRLKGQELVQAANAKR